MLNWRTRNPASALALPPGDVIVQRAGDNKPVPEECFGIRVGAHGELLGGLEDRGSTGSVGETAWWVYKRMLTLRIAPRGLGGGWQFEFEGRFLSPAEPECLREPGKGLHGWLWRCAQKGFAVRDRAQIEASLRSPEDWRLWLPPILQADEIPSVRADANGSLVEQIGFKLTDEPSPCRITFRSDSGGATTAEGLREALEGLNSRLYRATALAHATAPERARLWDLWHRSQALVQNFGLPDAASMTVEALQTLRIGAAALAAAADVLTVVENPYDTAEERAAALHQLQSAIGLLDLALLKLNSWADDAMRRVPLPEWAPKSSTEVGEECEVRIVYGDGCQKVVTAYSAQSGDDFSEGFPSERHASLRKALDAVRKRYIQRARRCAGVWFELEPSADSGDPDPAPIEVAVLLADAGLQGQLGSVEACVIPPLKCDEQFRIMPAQVSTYRQSIEAIETLLVSSWPDFTVIAPRSPPTGAGPEADAAHARLGAVLRGQLRSPAKLDELFGSGLAARGPALGRLAEKVWFPVIEGDGAQASLHSLELTLAPRDRPDPQAHVASFDGCGGWIKDREDRIQRLLQASRAFDGDEPWSEYWSTTLSFTGSAFSSNSYELALVLADRMVRGRLPRPLGRMIASGAISEAFECAEVFTVENVEGEVAKWACLEKEAQPGDRILLPRAWKNKVSVRGMKTGVRAAFIDRVG